VKREPQDEWASAQQVRRASQRPELAPVPVPSEQSSELQAQQQKASLGERPGSLVWERGQPARPERLASQEQAPRELAAVQLPGRKASFAPLLPQPLSLPSRL